jgi:CubicO group peptidase (beta-lactamase class C family)
MKTAVLIALAMIAALVLWAALVGLGARLGWARAMPAAIDDTKGFLQFAKERYATESKGNIVIVLLDHGKVAATYCDSHGRAVDVNSLFQVASLSKWLTAWGVMALVEQHRIDLDTPVDRYLTRWHLPPGAFDNAGVTVRRLLSHTAGLTDGLGFRGFAPDETLPSIDEELSHIADAMPESSGLVRVGAQPGSTWRYSGGGYLILQLLIEDVTHESFDDHMRRAVFLPLGMTESTFVNPDPSEVADFYAPDGSIATHYKFVALAAASLYTSASDLTRLIQAQLAGPNDESPGRGVLSPQTLRMMRTPQAFLFGQPVWGLGQALFATDANGGYVTGHDGGNYPAINTTARIDPANGNGVIVLETGASTLASEIGGAWTYWQTGTVPLDTLVIFDARVILIQFAAGALTIVCVSILIFRLARRRKKAAIHVPVKG